MSYWEEQYSMSPYGAQRSVPAARRNRGRPRTSKITGPRTNLDAPKPSKWVRMTQKELLASRSPHAKRELERRGILRGDSTTKRARGRKDKVTKAKGVTTWQAFMHECRGEGMTIQQMSRAYRKLMAEKPKRKAATRKATTRKTAARKTTTRKTKTTSKTRVSWVNFNATGAKRGYPMKQRQSKWKQYKAGEGTIASLFPAKKTRKTASKTRKTAPKTTRRTTRAKGRKTSTRRSKTQNKGLNRYQTWRKSLPQGVYTQSEIKDLWAMEKQALLNPHDYTHVREALVPAGYDYWDNSVPTAVRNPRTPRRSVPFRGARGQFSTGESWSHGIQPVNRRNPRSDFASDPWHPVYEQMIGQFSTGLATTHGIQPSNRRNPDHEWYWNWKSGGFNSGRFSGTKAQALKKARAKWKGSGLVIDASTFEKAGSGGLAESMSRVWDNPRFREGQRVVLAEPYLDLPAGTEAEFWHYRGDGKGERGCVINVGTDARPVTYEPDPAILQPSNRRNNPKKKRKARKNGKRKLTEYNKFCKKHMKEGYTMDQCAQMWRNRMWGA